MIGALYCPTDILLYRILCTIYQINIYLLMDLLQNKNQEKHFDISENILRYR